MTNKSNNDLEDLHSLIKKRVDEIADDVVAKLILGEGSNCEADNDEQGLASIVDAQVGAA